MRDVWECTDCPAAYDFSHNANGRYFRFPPLIGANGQADLLFVGINPRRSRSNFGLHNHIMASKSAFQALAENRFNEAVYISSDCRETHYRIHVELVEGIYGHGVRFEDVAAVTELYLCASENSSSLPRPQSPCAEKFMPRALRIVKPRAIIAMGARVAEFFNLYAPRQTNHGYAERDLWGTYYPVVELPHPGDPQIPAQTRIERTRALAVTLRSILSKQQV